MNPSQDEPLKPLTDEELATVLRALEVAADPFTTKAVALIRATIAELKDRLGEQTKLRAVLTEYVYETTHLSPEREDGSHDCRIPAKLLASARELIRAPSSIDLVPVQETPK